MKVDLDKLRKDIEELTELARKNKEGLELIQARTPATDLVKYLLYFWGGLSLALGAVGFATLGDIKEQVADQVVLQFPRDSQQYLDYEKLIGETEELKKDFQDLSQDYQRAVDALAYKDRVSKDWDLEGRVLRLIEESTARQFASRAIRNKLATTEGDGDKAYAGTLLEPAWRERALATLAALAESEKSFDPTLYFNAAQIARRLKSWELSQVLATKSASDDSPAHRALLLAVKVESESGSDREDAFKGLLAMVQSLDLRSPEIVLAEAWNAAESTRRYEELYLAIVDLEAAAGVYIPSYAYAIKAQALMRWGAPGSREEADSALDDAEKLLANESPMSSWYESSKRETLELRTRTRPEGSASDPEPLMRLLEQMLQHAEGDGGN